MSSGLPKAAEIFLRVQAMMAEYASMETSATLRAKDPRTGNRLDISKLQWERRQMAQAFDILRRARLFEIPAEVFGRLYHAADVFTTEVIAGVPWDVSMERAKEIYGSRDRAHEFFEKLDVAGKDLPLPEHLPFDVIFVVYPNLGLTPAQVWSRHFTGMDANTIVDTTHLGHLISSDGFVAEFIAVATVEHGGQFLFQVLRNKRSEIAPQSVDEFDERDRISTDGRWSVCDSLMPWVVPGVVNAINSYRTLVVQQPPTLSFRTEYAAHAKIALIVVSIEYRAGWRFSAIDEGCRGPNAMVRFRIEFPTVDSSKLPDIVPMTIVHEESIPVSFFDVRGRAQVIDYLFQKIVAAEEHEAREFFRVAGDRVRDPHR